MYFNRLLTTKLILMKTKAYFLVLAIFSIALFTSCDPNAIDGADNYWNSSSLIRLHLNDKVKTLSTDNGTNVMNFNQDGFTTSTVYSSGTGVSTTTFNYSSSGELTRTDFSSTMSNPTISYSTNYQYQDIGKFVVSFPFPQHLFMDGLVPNLKSMSMINGTYGNTTTYTFDGGNLTILTISTQGTETYKDTAVVIYSGKYPVSMSNSGSYANNITYASNGMFKTLTIGYDGSPNTTTHYFKADNTFLLKDSVVSNYGTTRYSEKYSYDSNKNISRIVYSDGTIHNLTYVYDAHGNWTTKTTTLSGTSTGSSSETRTITYW